MGSSKLPVTSTWDLLSVSSKESFDIHATVDCGFTLKRVRDMTRTYRQMQCTDKYSQLSSIIWSGRPSGWTFLYEVICCGFESSCTHLNFRFQICFEQGVFDIQATIECGFTLKRVHDMTRTYTHMHCTDKDPHLSSIIWSVWPNGWTFVYEVSRCGFESSCSNLSFRFRACFEQAILWHLGNYRVWIHSEMRTWHDKNIQSNALYR